MHSSRRIRTLPSVAARPHGRLGLRCALAAAVGLLAACAQTPPFVAQGLPGTCQARVLDRLSFGLSGPRGDIGDMAWQAFLSTEIAPRFPAGHTVFEAQGQWLGNDGQVVRERSRVVEVVHGGTTADSQRVREIVERYKQQQQQDAVLVTRLPALACL